MSDPKIFYANQAVTVAAATTDFFVLTGAANRTVRLRKLTFLANATSNTPVTPMLIKRSADNTGGTRSAFTAVAVDGVSVAAATAAGYTANPAGLGPSVGAVTSAGTTAVPTTSAATVITVFSPDVDPPIVLAPSEILALNLGGATVAGLVFTVTAAWDEI